MTCEHCAKSAAEVRGGVLDWISVMALPDVTVQFGQREEIRGGQRVLVPIAASVSGALFQTDADGMVEDADGVWWHVGWADGIRVRRRA